MRQRCRPDSHCISRLTAGIAPGASACACMLWCSQQGNRNLLTPYWKEIGSEEETALQEPWTYGCSTVKPCADAISARRQLIYLLGLDRLGKKQAEQDDPFVLERTAQCLNGRMGRWDGECTAMERREERRSRSNWRAALCESELPLASTRLGHIQFGCGPWIRCGRTRDTRCSCKQFACNRRDNFQ